MKMNISIYFLTLLMMACGSASSGTTTDDVVKKTTTPKKEAARIAFYNVENLFDTVNDPFTKDDEFTPESEKNWNKERYQEKLENISRVLGTIGGKHAPPIIGLCEVENKKVLKDLIKTSKFHGRRYGFVHRDSKDERGIDVALIFDQDKFRYTHVEALRVDLPAPFDHESTRDILYVKGLLVGEPIHFFVNHWSSRYGGVEHTESKRVACSKIVRAKIDSLFAAEENPNIVLMGDFNDEPENKSIKEVLQVKRPDNSPENEELYNLTYSIKESGRGSYNYKGNWNMLDQIIVSGNMLNTKNQIHADAETADICSEKWMTYNDKKFGPKPNKSYGGPNYYGGYSDHFPVYVDLITSQ